MSTMSFPVWSLLLLGLLMVSPYLVNGRSEPIYPTPEPEDVKLSCEYEVKKILTECDECFATQKVLYSRVSVSKKLRRHCRKNFVRFQTCVGCEYVKTDKWTSCLDGGYKYKLERLVEGCPGYCPRMRFVRKSETKCEKIPETIIEPPTGISIGELAGTLSCEYEPVRAVSPCNEETVRQRVLYKRISGPNKFCKANFVKRQTCLGCSYAPSGVIDPCCNDGHSCKLDKLVKGSSEICPRYRCLPKNKKKCLDIVPEVLYNQD